jgi:hypothetical protein
MGSDGTVNLGNAGSNPYMIPMDITQAANNAASPSSSVTPYASSTSALKVSASASPTPAGAAKANAARSLGSSGALIGVVAFLSAFLAL